MRKFTLIILIALFGIISHIRADEGMWIPILLEKYNYADMKAKGLKLSPEDIYSINQACLKDAIVIFGRGCTGELISDKGLLITNHHCGYGQIQSHSSVENDYLTNGFWAMSPKEELINPGLTVTFLVRMEDVSEKVLKNVTAEMNETDRQKSISEAIEEISKQSTEGTNYKAEIKSFYYGNEYYLFVSEVYKDVRFVGAPPSAIGKFGGDTDNWMWPRHTGDFSLFRIYANKNNEPAEYSKDNVPYQPKKHFPISLKGVKKGDFTMVYGYPYTTTQFLTSFAVELKTKVNNPNRIEIRGNILDIMKTDMDESDKVRIQYSSKYAGVSNAWKKWIGENRGLRKLNAIDKKQELEKQFVDWANSNPARKEKYGSLISEYEKIYSEIEEYSQAIDYFHETAFRSELLLFAMRCNEIVKLKSNFSEERMKIEVKKLKSYSKSMFKNYNQPTDKKLFSKVFLKMFSENVDKKFQPDFFNKIEKKYKGNYSEFTEHLFAKSFMADELRVNKLLENISKSSLKKIEKDPVYKIYKSVVSAYLGVNAKFTELNQKISEMNRIYVAGLREMQTSKTFYPDANATLRITYGKVDDYNPRDGVHYDYFTTLSGIIEKDNPDIYDYKVPQKLKELYAEKDYGQYAENGKIHVCFTASNHTTGGNSGSPVLNGNGELIGVNFDRNWEGTMSDIMYDPDQCRNITLDIRYALFIIDKFAGAKHLIEEMTIVK
ncbi:MAG: S46 family peptidase [Bacteroidetes bacterium]|jgi:hypothetical protein|nr:S46 family peptidase [Bacteroidota bacterium]MBT6687470.1 S46 family peptidase [Bacteroidota bacterium]MBT7142656.1 S46 family peptidase [Bacteroidota bacterium]MBT7493055.1 S46 family peptidase [Bacteroidota bacterium]